MEKDIIAYGSGEAYKFFTEYYQIVWQFTVDGDSHKWSKENKVYPKEALELLCFDKKQKILIFPFASQSIVAYLLQIGFEEHQFIFFKMLLEQDNELNKAYEISKKNSSSSNQHYNELMLEVRDMRKKYLNQISTSKDIEELFASFYDQAFYYKGILLNEVLAADLNNLISYILFPTKLSHLFYQPTQNTFRIYGNGPIFIPFFATFRQDHTNRINRFIDLIGKENITLLTLDGFKTDMTLIKEALFKFDGTKNNKLAFEFVDFVQKKIGKLSYQEKEWLSYTVLYHMQVIDFFTEFSKEINVSILFSLFPYYLAENIIHQVTKKQKVRTIIHQHGKFANENGSQEIHSLIYKFNLHADYYLVWNEHSKRVLVDMHSKDERKIHVLGNIINYNKKYNSECHKKFLVILPGRIINFNEIISKVIDLSIDLAGKLNIKFDIRYHPLNVLNNVEIYSIDAFNNTVDISNCDFNNYEFIIGRDSALLDELNESGHLVFNITDNDFVNDLQFVQKVILERDNFYSNIMTVEQIAQDNIFQSYKSFLDGLLSDEALNTRGRG